MLDMSSDLPQGGNVKQWESGFHKSVAADSFAQSNRGSKPGAIHSLLPPIPPRQNQQPPDSLTTPLYHQPSLHSMYPPGGQLGGYFGAGPFMSNSLYSPYNFGGVYGGGGWPTNPNTTGANANHLTRRIEDHFRPAFDSVLSVVHACHSVSTLVESTYIALYTSFRAVLGLADHMGGLTRQTKHLLASIRLVRWLRRCYWRLARWLGWATHSTESDRVWSEVHQQSGSRGTVAAAAATLAAAALATSGPDGEQVASSPAGVNWVLVLFLLLLAAGPALIWRLIVKWQSSTAGDAAVATNGSSVTNGDEDYVGDVRFNFIATRPDEMTVTAGQRVRVAAKRQQTQERGWLLVTNSSNGSKGLVPSDYVQVLGRISSS